MFPTYIVPMRQTKYPQSLVTKITEHQRKAIEHLAETQNLGLGEAARELLDAGIKARGLVA